MPSTRSTARQNVWALTEDDDRITNTLLTLNILYQTHIHPHLPEPLQPISSNITSLILSSAPYLSQTIGLIRSVVSSAWSASQGQSQDGSALLSLGALLITLYMGLRIMNYIRRTIMGWIWLGIKLILVFIVVQMGFYINSYGWERAMSQAGWLGGIVWGILEDAMDQKQGGEPRPPRGTRRRGPNNYNYNNYGYGQAGGRGRYG